MKLIIEIKWNMPNVKHYVYIGELLSCPHTNCHIHMFTEIPPVARCALLRLVSLLL